MAEQKKGQIQIFAKNIKGVSRGGILEESKFTRNFAGGNHIQNGGNGVNNGTNRSRTSTEETRVKTIKLLDELDDGSANDGSRTNIKKGALHKKTYRFEVEAFTKGEPRNLNNIKWAISYTDPDSGHVYDNIITNSNPTGKSININFSSNFYCGRNLEVRAYISEAESEGRLTIFMHNSFRWFDGQILEQELKSRSTSPWLINQSGTSLCGMACIFYLFAKEKNAAYTDFAKTLFRKGEASFKQCVVKPTEELLSKEIDANGFPKDTRNMPLVDFVTMAGTRNSDNHSYKGGDEEFQAINWPNLMTGLTEKLLGYSEVSSDGIYNPVKKSRDYYKPTVWKMIEDINLQIASGHRMILMIDSDLISDDEDTIWNMFALEYHWIVLETPITTIQNLNSEGEIFYTLNFKVYTWGSLGKYLQKVITLDHFIHNYYGYIKAK